MNKSEKFIFYFEQVPLKLWIHFIETLMDASAGRKIRLLWKLQYNERINANNLWYSIFKQPVYIVCLHFRLSVQYFRFSLINYSLFFLPTIPGYHFLPKVIITDLVCYTPFIKIKLLTLRHPVSVNQNFDVEKIIHSFQHFHFLNLWGSYLPSRRLIAISFILNSVVGFVWSGFMAYQLLLVI